MPIRLGRDQENVSHFGPRPSPCQFNNQSEKSGVCWSVASTSSGTTRTILIDSSFTELSCPGMRRQQTDRNSCCRHQKNESDASPHQRPRALLVLQCRQSEQALGTKIDRIDYVFTKCQVGGKNVARESSGEQVEEDRPPGPNGNTRPGLDNRPPKKKARREKRRMLNDVPTFRLHGEVEHSRDVPSDQRRCR